MSRSLRIRIYSDDTERVDFLLDCINAGCCLRCGGRARLINHGRSVFMEHRDGCPLKTEEETQAQLPSTFRK